jgi:FeS assembly SUF system protein
MSMATEKFLPVVQPAQPAAPKPPESRTSGMVEDASVANLLKPKVVAAIRTVYDPEIPVNVFDLGLIYDIIIDAASLVGIRMTLTAPNCPAAQWLPGQVEAKVKAIDGVADVRLDVVFDPPWTRDRMSDVAKLELGMW